MQSCSLVSSPPSPGGCIHPPGLSKHEAPRSGPFPSSGENTAGRGVHAPAEACPGPAAQDPGTLICGRKRGGGSTRALWVTNRGGRVKTNGAISAARTADWGSPGRTFAGCLPAQGKHFPPRRRNLLYPPTTASKGLFCVRTLSAHPAQLLLLLRTCCVLAAGSREEACLYPRCALGSGHSGSSGSHGPWETLYYQPTTHSHAAPAGQDPCPASLSTVNRSQPPGMRASF